MSKRGDNVVWQHDKRETRYRIFGFATDQNGVPVVIYAPVGHTAAQGDSQMHVRPCNEFFDGRFSQIVAKAAQPRNMVRPNFGPALNAPANVVPAYGLPDDDTTQVAQRDTSAARPDDEGREH